MKKILLVMVSVILMYLSVIAFEKIVESPGIGEGILWTIITSSLACLLFSSYSQARSWSLSSPRNFCMNSMVVGVLMTASGGICVSRYLSGAWADEVVLAIGYLCVIFGTIFAGGFAKLMSVCDKTPYEHNESRFSTMKKQLHSIVVENKGNLEESENGSHQHTRPVRATFLR